MNLGKRNMVEHTGIDKCETDHNAASPTNLLKNIDRLIRQLYILYLGDISMPGYKNLGSLLKGVLDKEINEWVYANIAQVNSDPLKATYYIFPEKEMWNLEESLVYQNEDGCTLPIEYKDENLQAWIEVAMIEDAIEVLKRKNKNPSLSLIAEALQYYNKNDAFME